MAVNSVIVKWGNIIIVITLSLLVVIISVVISNLAGIGTILSDVNPDSELNAMTDTQKQALYIGFMSGQRSVDKNFENSQPGRNETIEETITRIKRDVVVTGTVTGIPGKETAYFQIEGMSDRAFLINTQLMDGFIINEITETQIILKNQKLNF